MGDGYPVRNASYVPGAAGPTAELLALVAGFFLFADLRRRRALSPAHAWSGLILGLGASQVFDGLVDHEVLRVHKIRYGVDVTPYDWAWNLAGVALLLVGAVRCGGGAGPVTACTAYL
ncbi:DUF2243 domain-containing protein [Streptomyces longwoodensis]|uniref:DUF2243 domain-containing protein n=1 Tax=Streptomyces longwoodensis TaxID=68231 RepID=UPI0033B505A3